MKDIMLRITGKTVKHRNNEDHLEDVMELTTEGKLYQRGHMTYVTYQESELSGREGFCTSLIIGDNKVKMQRSGKAHSVPTVIEFEKGKRFETRYDTPFGPIGMELLTNSISEYTPDEDGKGKLSIDYDISLKGFVESRNKLDIEIM